VSHPRKKPSDKQPQGEDIRLNRFIANAGVCSRRDADKLIEAGEITVNGKVVTEMGVRVSRTDKVKHKGKLLKPERAVYILLNKPKDFITTMDDERNRRTVMSLVKKASDARIYPVGRLDRMTTGLLLFTNDGDLAKKLSHPSSNVKKIYQVEINRPITKTEFEEISAGLELEDGKATLDKLVILNDEKTLLGIEIHIGRNRIIRRIFEHIGAEVVKLDRVMYAGLDKYNLPRGNWRPLTPSEIRRLKQIK
jgi:23S rRNA pseudouridine2605 synthase